MGKRTSKKPLIIGLAVILVAAILLGILLIWKANNPDPVQPANDSTQNTTATNNGTMPSNGADVDPTGSENNPTEPENPTANTNPTNGTEPSNPGPVMDPDDIIPDGPDIGIQIPSSTSN